MTKEKAIHTTPSGEIKHSEGESAVTRAGRFKRGLWRNLVSTLATLTVCFLARANAAAKYNPCATTACTNPSPVIIDTTGEGFHLTSAKNGVKFDIAGDGHPIQMGWTARGSTNAFLALPRDGKITNGKELFGNFTPQPPSNHPNGFLALSVYDLPENGGNGDGVIDAQDAIFPSLVLWIDSNHDGVAQPEEMHSLPELGVFSISLDYKLSWRVDQFGNLFRYKSQINAADPTEDDSHAGPICYDVFFVTLDDPSPDADDRQTTAGGSSSDKHSQAPSVSGKPEPLLNQR
jgi:hypothetical protein